VTLSEQLQEHFTKST